MNIRTFYAHTTTKVIFRLGKIWDSRPCGPGIVLVFPFVDEYQIIDLRLKAYDVPTQELLTLDFVTVAVDAVVYYSARDPIACLSEVYDANYSTRQLAQTTLHNTLSRRTLAQIMADRDGVAAQMKHVLEKTSSIWGIRVERVLIKDIRLPTNLYRAMAAETEAVRAANAKLSFALGEIKASDALRQAANELTSSPAALQLRYMHTLTKISAQNNHTIVLPLPLELVQSFTGTLLCQRNTSSYYDRALQD
ncbi:Stomatin-3 [Trichostrongylus colubriformis]|uniref:Stomatin-3 n=1 Tax=Trichostrongylus colubriformis TaxID=6319 RepID=A0AAN8INH5_TRICO